MLTWKLFSIYLFLSIFFGIMSLCYLHFLACGSIVSSALLYFSFFSLFFQPPRRSARTPQLFLAAPFFLKRSHEHALHIEKRARRGRLVAEVTLALAILRAGLRVGPALRAQPATPRTQGVSSSVWSKVLMAWSSQGSRVRTCDGTRARPSESSCPSALW